MSDKTSQTEKLNFCELNRSLIASGNAKVLEDLSEDQIQEFFSHAAECEACESLINECIIKAEAGEGDLNWLLELRLVLVGVDEDDLSPEDRATLEEMHRLKEEDERRVEEMVDKFIRHYYDQLDPAEFGLPSDLSRLTFFYAWQAIAMLASGATHMFTGSYPETVELTGDGRLRINRGSLVLPASMVTGEVKCWIDEARVNPEVAPNMVQWVYAAVQVCPALLDVETVKKAGTGRRHTIDAAWSV